MQALAVVFKIGGASLVSQLVNDVLNELCSTGSFELAFYASKIGCAEEDVVRLKSTVSQYVVGVSTGKVDAQTATKLLEQLPQEVQQIVGHLVSARGPQVKAAVTQSTQVAGYVLKNFDWQCHLMLASSKIAEVSEPRVVLQLSLEHAKDSSQKKTAVAELNKKELDKFIEQLQTIKQTIDNYN